MHKREEKARYQVVEYADPDLTRAALGFLESEWGSYGYRAGIRRAAPGYVELQVRHFDGAEFVIGYRDTGAWWYADVTLDKEVPF